MKVHDEFISEDLFSELVAQMPQVCVELILQTKDWYLIAKRDIEPKIWFWPGSRLYKDEELGAAAHRIATEELDIEVDIEDQYGPYAHFWENSSVEGSSSRHTVNVVFYVILAREQYEITLDDQHSEYRFLTELEDDNDLL